MGTLYCKGSLCDVNMPTYDKYHRDEFFRWYFHYSPDGETRASITSYCNAPGSTRRSESTCYRWLQELREQDRDAPARKRTRKLFSCVLPEHMIYLLNYIDDIDPCIGIVEMAAVLEEQFNVNYTRQQIGAALDFNEYNQKSVEYVATERNELVRAQYLQHIRPPHEGGMYTSNMFVFIDETHVNEGKACMRKGWSRSGTPVRQPVRRAIGLGVQIAECVP